MVTRVYFPPSHKRISLRISGIMEATRLLSAVGGIPHLAVAFASDIRLVYTGTESVLFHNFFRSVRELSPLRPGAETQMSQMHTE